mmetsp:Transcript_49532/g.160030  ORF Transcript_49532/g.160030 Transcript_49532/m.160030 type:complete len:208 (+) Transcript_49532:1156-1779(+)
MELREPGRGLVLLLLVPLVDGHQVDEEVRRVEFRRQLVATLAEIVHSSIRGACVHRLAGRQQVDPGEHREDRRSRLMDADHNGVSFSRQIGELFHDVQRLVTVKAACRLVQENDARLVQELQSDGQAFALAARQPAQCAIERIAADVGVPDLEEPELPKHLLNSAITLLLRCPFGQTQAALKVQGLLRRAQCIQDILLLDVRRYVCK